MLSSVAALTNGYTSPMAMPQSRVAASMDASADLKALAKSLNPVVVSRRARIACTATVSHSRITVSSTVKLNHETDES